MKVTGGDRIAIKAMSKETRHYRPLGFDLVTMHPQAPNGLRAIIALGIVIFVLAGGYTIAWFWAAGQATAYVKTLALETASTGGVLGWPGTKPMRGKARTSS